MRASPHTHSPTSLRVHGLRAGGESARGAVRERGVQSRGTPIARAAADRRAQGGGDRCTSRFGGLAPQIHHLHAPLLFYYISLNTAIEFASSFAGFAKFWKSNYFSHHMNKIVLFLLFFKRCV